MGFSIGAFVLGFTFLACGATLQVLTARSSGSPFMMMAFPWFGLGVLASWIGGSLKQQSDRLDRIESRLGDRDGS